jgi:uncharacterized SAM-binding protein YcdF (DUF218 family)
VSRRTAPLAVLALAPLLALAAALGTFVAVWTAPGTDVARAAPWAPVAADACPAAAIVVMGAAQYDGVPSAVLERRLSGALRLYAEGCAPVIVVSGGARVGDRTSEGAAGVAWLAAQGVPTAALRAETRATTSVENLRFARDVAPAGHWVVVTDDLHGVRTAAVAQRLGLDVDVVGVRTDGTGAEGAAERARYALRETFAMLAYRLGAFR